MDIQKVKERIDKEYRNRLFEPLQEKWRVLRPGEGCWLTAAWITDHLGLPACPLSECLLGVCMYNTDDVLKIFDWIDNFAHEHGYYDEFYKVHLDQIREEEAAHDREAMKILAQIAGMPEGYSADMYTKKIIWGKEKGEQSMHPHDEPMLTLNFDIPTLGSTLSEEKGENCMKYQLKRDLTMSFTAENAEVNQDMIDQLIVNEIISEVVDATNKIFNEHLKKHGISATSIRSDEIMSDVRKCLYDDLKPLVEPKAKKEPKTKTRVDYRCKLDIRKKDMIAEEIVEKFGELFEDAAECVISSQVADDITDEDRDDIAAMARNKLRKAIDIAPTAKEETKMSIYESHIYNADYTCHIKLDRISGDCDQTPTYEFHGETTDFDKMLSRIKKRGGMPIANRIWQNDGRHTTVEWRDGTKTTVCCEDPEKYTEWGGFCACVAKKLYGSTTKAEDMLENAKEYTAWSKKKKEIEREKIKKMCHNRAVMEREKKIAAKMEEMWIANEATKRMYPNDSKVEVKDGAEEEK